MKQVILSLIAIFALCGAGRSEAESVAVIDTQAVLNQSIIGKAAKANLEERVKKAQVKLGALKADFDKQRADLEKQSTILSGSALEARREALEKKGLEVQRRYQDAQEELSKANEEELKRVVEEIRAVVEELATDRDYKFVIERDRQSVLYSSDRIDISAEVVKILDKKKVAL
jgi:outer membrane protein